MAAISCSCSNFLELPISSQENLSCKWDLLLLCDQLAHSDQLWSGLEQKRFAPFSQLLTILTGFVCQRLDKKKTNCSFATSLGVVWNVCGFLIRWRKRRGEGNSFVPLSPPCLPSLKRVSYPCLHYSLKRVSDRYWWGIGGTVWWQVTADLEAIQMLTNTLPNVDK